ncbi:phage tail protein [Azospirillum melinis]|uniref:Phage tail protein n=1 Tax=Azospirillum melinis TaxID=328839 RepID=A0ABX2KHY3_9PROT|nr:tail fiber protein [Azospirillum melinis]MBP2307526.1 microcystin-dependent protein [Azospirillum melinis]NUB01403.1 phage tail protein [Azospirillum melinis]
MDAYLGLIFPFAGTFAPYGTVQCWGQDLPTAQNQALYSIIVTVYGGNNVNFKVPDLRGRVMVGSGVSPYLGNLTLNPGGNGGTASTTLGLANLPLHTHAASFTPAGGSSTSAISANVTIPISTSQGASATPTGGANYLGGIKVSDPSGGLDWQTDGPYAATAPAAGANLVGTATGTVTVSGGGGTVAVSPGGGQAAPAAINNLQPYLAVTMYIVTMGLYPTRD